MIDILPLRRITLLALLLLSLVAVASRLISGAGIPVPAAMADPPPHTAFGTTAYVGMTNMGIGDVGLYVWEFNDPSCQGPLRILMLPLSGKSAPLSRVLRQSGEDVAYWYGGALYDAMERPAWLFRYAIGWLSSPLIKRRPPNDFYYLLIFHPSACATPPGANWPMLAAAIHP